MGSIGALSISRPVAEWLPALSQRGRVLAAFPHACNLVAPNGALVALVTPAVGDGPLNIVVEADGLPDLAAGELAWLDQRAVSVGSLTVALAQARVWDPRPDWQVLRSQLDTIRERLPAARAAARLLAPAESLLALLELGNGTPLPSFSPMPQMALAASRAADALRDGWLGDADRLLQGAAQMAGLGLGLTPAGDDFLVGVMLWAWLAHPQPAQICQQVTQAAETRTTQLSAAWLRAAAGGLCSAAWHQLLHALAGGAELRPAVAQVLAHGATSGADMLAGFLSWSDMTLGA